MIIKVLFFVYAVVVLIFAFYPSLSVPEVSAPFSPDKIAHFAQYFIFAFLYYIYRTSCKAQRKAIFIELFFIGAMISVFTEVIQEFIPGRSKCWWDVLANLLGFYGFIAFKLIRRKKNV